MGVQATLRQHEVILTLQYIVSARRVSALPPKKFQKFVLLAKSRSERQLLVAIAAVWIVRSAARSNRLGKCRSSRRRARSSRCSGWARAPRVPQPGAHAAPRGDSRPPHNFHSQPCSDYPLVHNPPSSGHPPTLRDGLSEGCLGFSRGCLILQVNIISCWPSTVKGLRVRHAPILNVEVLYLYNISHGVGGV